MDFFRKLVALPRGASTFAWGIDLLHLVIIATTMIVSTYVFVSAASFAIRYYRGDRAKRDTTPMVKASPKREAAIIGVVLATFIVWWIVGFNQYVHMADPPKDAMTIVVTGKQWMWKFTYPDGRDANDVLTVPVNRPIRLLMTSRDVIHSFYVPQFRIKHDLLPGQYVTTWFQATEAGEYDIFCAEYCGVNHSRMLGRVVVLSEADYEKWLRAGGTAPESGELAQRGVAIATRRACVACHTLDGQPHVGPTWARLYGRTVQLADGRTIVADDAYLTRSMMEPTTDVVQGYKPVMPSYAGLLTPGEVGALVELIRSLKDAPAAPGIQLPHLETRAIDGGPSGAAPSEAVPIQPQPFLAPNPNVAPAPFPTEPPRPSTGGVP